MKIHEFMLRFPDEKSCRIHYKEEREKNGVICKKCGGTIHYWLAKKWQWQCKKCRYRTTLRSGTGMQFANLPLHKWYLCMALMAATKKGISAKEMQRQMGHSRYRTIWELMQKVRAGMAASDDKFNLENILETEKDRIKVNPVERGKSCSRPKKSSSKLNYAIMEGRIKEILNEWRSFKDLKEPIPKVEWIGENDSVMPGFSFFYNTYMSYDPNVRNERAINGWVNLMDKNARRNIFGVYHRISSRFLQNYLSEFCFRLNRRTFGERRFESLVYAVIGKYCGTIATMQ